MDQTHGNLGDWWAQDQYGNSYHDANAFTAEPTDLSHQLVVDSSQSQRYTDSSQTPQFSDFASYGVQSSSMWDASGAPQNSSYADVGNTVNGQFAYLDLPSNVPYFNGPTNGQHQAPNQGSFSHSHSNGTEGTNVDVQQVAVPTPQWQQILSQMSGTYGSPSNASYDSPNTAALQTDSLHGKAVSPASYADGQSSAALQAFQPGMQTTNPTSMAITPQPPIQPATPPVPQSTTQRKTCLGFQPKTLSAQSPIHAGNAPAQSTMSSTLHTATQQMLSQTAQRLSEVQVAQGSNSSAPSSAQPTTSNSLATAQAGWAGASLARLAPVHGAHSVLTKSSAPHSSRPGASIDGDTMAMEASTKVTPNQASFQTGHNPHAQETMEPKTTSAKLVQSAPIAADASIVSGTLSNLRIDEEAKQLARDHKESCWKGVPNLAISHDFEMVRVPERIPRQTMYLKEVKGPLLTDRGRESLWTPAEILGWHQNEFLRYPRHEKYDLDRLKADATLEVMMKRAKKTVAKTWWTDSIPNEAKKRKLPEWMPGTAPLARSATPADEVVRLEVKMSAILATPILNLETIYQLKPAYVKKMADECAALLSSTMEQLKTSKVFANLSKTYTERKKKGASAELDGRIALLKGQLRPLLQQLGCAFDVYLQQERRPLNIFMGSKKQSLIVGLFNTVIRLLNIKEGTSSPLISLVRFLTLLKSVKLSELETWKFTSAEGKACTKTQLEALGNEEITQMATIIVRNAELNKAKDVAPLEGTASDSKAVPSTVKKPVKAGIGIGAVPGAKRAWEDDGEVRSAKKMTTDANGLSGPGLMINTTKSQVTGPKMAVAHAQGKAATAGALPAKTPGTAEGVAPLKRSTLLLPGKVRPVVRPIVKAASLKVEPTKPVKVDVSAATIPSQKVDAKVSTSQPSTVKPAAAAPEAVKASKPSAPEASQSGKSSLAALLAEIDEPKKLVKVRDVGLSDVPVDPNESEQDRTRRLRKEERRRLGLRVRFRSDERLVEIREFQSEEGEARGGNTRDVRSDRTDKMEGMALKKGLAGEIRPWEELSAADLGNIPAEKRKETFASRGGDVTTHTDQQKVMEEREKTELMVLYMDPSDIPPTPRSPSHSDSTQPDAASASMQDVRVPDGAGFEEWHQRHRDQILFGPQLAIANARHRLALKGNADLEWINKGTDGVTPIADTNHSAVVRRWEVGPFVDRAYGEARDFELYRALVSIQGRTYFNRHSFDPAHPKTKRRTDYSDPEVQRAVDFVEETVAAFARAQADKAKQGLAQQDVAMTDAPALAQTAQPANDYSAAWAAYYMQMQQAQAAAAAYGQPSDVLAQAQLAWTSPLQAPAPQSQANDLSVLLAQLGGGPASQQQAQPAVGGTGVQELVAALTGASVSSNQQQAQAQSQQSADYVANYMRWMMAQGQEQNATAAGYGQQQQQQQSAQGGYDQSYGRSHDDKSQQPQQGQGGGRINKRRQRLQQDRRGDSGGTTDGDDKDVAEHLRGINLNLIGTKKCMFFAEGRCTKGTLCTFRHE